MHAARLDGRPGQPRQDGQDNDAAGAQVPGRQHQKREDDAERCREHRQDAALAETVQGPAGQGCRYSGADTERRRGQGCGTIRSGR